MAKPPGDNKVFSVVGQRLYVVPLKSDIRVNQLQRFIQTLPDKPRAQRIVFQQCLTPRVFKQWLVQLPLYVEYHISDIDISVFSFQHLVQDAFLQRC